MLCICVIPHVPQGQHGVLLLTDYYCYTTIKHQESVTLAMMDETFSFVDFLLTLQLVFT